MAKKPPPQKRRPAPAKTPARGGRPTGLFTWLAVGLVVVIVVALVVIKIASSSPSADGSSKNFQPTDPTTFAELTTVPASVFNTVGVTSPVAEVTPPQYIAHQPALTTTDEDGKTVPEVLFIGAEYCPYCAAQRWTTIIALSRFGTWGGLGNMSSYSQDVYPNTPSFTFIHATYKSKYLVFKSVEEYTNYVDPATNYYAPLQSPTAAEAAIFKKYDSPKYIHGLTAALAESIPFISYANKYFVVGASYSPATLSGSTRSEIAAGLSNATSPITEAIIASANYQTAVVCSLTNGQPTNVCTSPGVLTAAKAMDMK